MNLRSLLATTFAGFLAMPMPAQACPMERTKHVGLDVTIGPMQSCGGFNYQVGGVQVGTPQNGCPLFLIVTPPHEVAEPTNQDTKVVGTGNMVPITMVTFVCATDWFIIIPVGSSCTLASTVNVGAIERLVTVGCPPASSTKPPVGN